MKIAYRHRQVEDVDVFYREAGPTVAPIVLLLHGFPSSSHMFRDLIPELAKNYRVIAPDLPGFGLTVAPPRSEFDYTFDHLAEVIEGFIAALALPRFASSTTARPSGCAWQWPIRTRSRRSSARTATHTSKARAMPGAVAAILARTHGRPPASLSRVFVDPGDSRRAISVRNRHVARVTRWLHARPRIPEPS